MAALERSEERRIESSDLERLMPGVSGCLGVLTPESCSLIIAATPCCRHGSAAQKFVHDASCAGTARAEAAPHKLAPFASFTNRAMC